MIDRVPVSSTNVASVGYDDATSTLEVEFRSGHVYHYLAVPTHHYLALTTGTGSVGRYLNIHVKPHYRCLRVT